MRLAILSLLFAGLFALPSARGQSTISDRPLELTFGKASWGALLPSYELGDNGTGGLAYQDDGDSPGALWQAKGVRRFLGTRTSFEARAFYGFAWSNVTDPAVAGGTIPNPATGVAAGFAGPRHLDSDVHHYGFDFTLRDTWRIDLGGLSAGMTFSYMAFAQYFNVESNGVRLIREDLDSDFTGGKGFVGWDGCIFGRQSNIDIAGGIFDLNMDYQFTGGLIPGARSINSGKTATTGEIYFTMREQFGDYLYAITVGGMYITDMPTIQHNAGTPVTLGTDDAATITLMVEILL